MIRITERGAAGRYTGQMDDISPSLCTAVIAGVIGFETPRRSRVPVVTVAEMRALDAAAEVAGYGLPQMVEHAGRHLANLCHLLGAWPRHAPPRVVVLAGSGGNGAGVLAAARHLANAGASVKIRLGQSAAESNAAVARQLDYLTASRVTISSPGSRIPRGADLILDGLVGYGLHGPLRGENRELVEELAGMSARHSALVVSLDVPSGLNPDTGIEEGVAVHPAATLAVALPKCGLLHPEAGDVWLADIGLPRHLFSAAEVPAPPVEIAANGLTQLSRRFGTCASPVSERAAAN